jgi:hypothetical protein
VACPLVEVINSLYPRVFNLMSLLDAAALDEGGFHCSSEEVCITVIDIIILHIQ